MEVLWALPDFLALHVEKDTSLLNERGSDTWTAVIEAIKLTYCIPGNGYNDTVSLLGSMMYKLKIEYCQTATYKPEHSNLIKLCCLLSFGTTAELKRYTGKYENQDLIIMQSIMNMNAFSPSNLRQCYRCFMELFMRENLSVPTDPLCIQILRYFHRIHHCKSKVIMEKPQRGFEIRGRINITPHW